MTIKEIVFPFNAQTKKPDQGDRPGERVSSLSSDIRYTSSLFGLTLLFGALLIIRAQKEPELLLLWALAFTAVGGAIGFLFGIPKILQGSKASQSGPAGVPAFPGLTTVTGIQGSVHSPQTQEGAAGSTNQGAAPTSPAIPSKPMIAPAYQQLVNTNLEEISDWLTKIIVGLGLVNLTNLPRALSYIAKCITADQPISASLATVVIVYFTIIGFLYGYLLTRLALQCAFARADQAAADQRGTLLKQQEHNEGQINEEQDQRVGV